MLIYRRNPAILVDFADDIVDLNQTFSWYRPDPRRPSGVALASLFVIHNESKFNY